MKKSFLIVLLLPQLLNAKLEPIENNYLVKAIAENDFVKFSEILKNSKDPFKKRSLLGDAEEQAIRSSTQEIQYKIANSKGCKDEFVQELLKYDFKPLLMTTISSGGKDLSIWQQLCSKTIAALIPSFNEDDQIKIGEEVVDATTMLMKKSFSQAAPANEAELKNAGDSVAIFSEKIKSECKEYSLKNKWCLLKDKIIELQKTVKKDLEKLETEEKAEAYANSPEGLEAEYCDIQERISEAQTAIERQKEIGKSTGVVDANVLHTKGATVVDLKKQASEIQSSYKTKFKSKKKLTCN